uniref:F-box associated domain-containing protein n=1 Tax=Oryza meridionalis TaxID=40149 RepID=A0A0E0E3G2_9ORYZ
MTLRGSASTGSLERPGGGVPHRGGCSTRRRRSSTRCAGRATTPVLPTQDADWTGQLIGIQGTMAASSYDGVVALWLLRDYDEEAWECVCTRVAAGFLDRRRGRDDGVLRRLPTTAAAGTRSLLLSSQGHRYGVYNLRRGEVVAAGRELGGTQYVYQESFASPVARRGVGDGAPSPRGELAAGAGEASSSSLIRNSPGFYEVLIFSLLS